MYLKVVLGSYLFLFMLSRYSATHAVSDKIVCYLRSWAKYDQLGEKNAFNINDLDVSLCTHLVYAHAGVNDDGTIRVKDPDRELSTDTKEGIYQQVVNLRAKSPTTKFLIAVGGWNEGCEKFSKIAASFSLRKRMVRSAIAFLHKHKFDGIDLDWEFPTQRGCGVADKMNNIELIKDLRKGFDVHDFLLISSVAAPKYTTGRSYDVPQLSQYLDLIIVLAYDFHGPWEERSVTGIHAPLHPAPSDETDLQKQQTVFSSINNWIELGANPEIIVLAIGFYGRTYTLANAEKNDIASPSLGPGNVGPYTNEKGLLAYLEICELFNKETWTLKWSKEQKAPYASKGNQWIGYENENSIKEKVAFAKSLNLAGVMAYSLDFDDFLGRCGPKYPLLNAMKSALTGEAPPQHSADFKPTIDKGVTNKVVCYFRSWSIYNKEQGSYDIENIDPTLCTHLIFCFMGIKDDGTILVKDPYNSLTENWGRGALKRFNELKAKSPGTKTLISVGGYAEGCKTFSQMSASFSIRKKFASSIVEFIKTHGFDGLDLDWEFPAQLGCPQSDQQNFVELLKVLRREFDKHKYILSSAVAASEYSASKSYLIDKISRYVDQMHIMAYDMHGPWDNTTGQNSPLYASPVDTTETSKMFNINASVNYWLSKGAPPEKLILGIPLYGRTYTLADKSQHDIGSPAKSPGKAGTFTTLEGTLGYNEICLLLTKENYNLEWSNEQKVPFAYKEDQWIGFDNPRSAQGKVEFAKSLGLGGIMVYGIDNDDFRGSCGKKNIMLTTINEAL